MTPHQIRLVQLSWTKVIPLADLASTLFYARLFQLDPTLRSLFGPDMVQQGRKLVIMIDTAVNGLNDLDQLMPAVETLGRRHGGYGVKDEHYATVGAALLWTLEQALGANFDSATRSAWVEVYSALAVTMKHAAHGTMAA